MVELSLAIGGLRAAIRTADPEIASVVETRYKGFISPGPPDWRIEAGAQRATARPPSGDVEVRHEGQRRFSVKRSDLTGSLDLAERSGQVMLVPGEIAVESFLRIAYSLALVDVHGLLPHASCVIRSGKAYLFCGPSGRGKTTVARLSSEAIVLTDELPVVKVANGRAIAYGTPFWGELACGAENRSAPLGGIYFLHQGSRHAREPIGPGRALGRLLPNVLFFASEVGLPARMFGIAADLVEAVPAFDLCFRPDPGFWEVISDD